MARLANFRWLGWFSPVLVLVGGGGVLLVWLSGGGVVAGLGVILAALCLSGVATWKLLQQASSFELMTERFDRICSGDYKAVIDKPHDQGSEMERLAGDAIKRLLGDLGFTQGVLKGMATPCVVVDSEQILRFTNRNLLNILQHDGKPEDFYGQNVAFFFYGDATRPTVLGQAMRESRDITKEVELTGRKGGKRNIRIDASPVYDLQGRLMGALCVYADLTELRAQEAKLLEVNAKTEQTSEQAEAISAQLEQSARQLERLVSDSLSGARRQSQCMAQTLSSVENMNHTVLDVAHNASQASDTAAEARRCAEEGSQVVGKVVDGIEEVQRRALALKDEMAGLGSQAESIGRIMNVISDIADQTNLLALNAAIEAARAGDAGRGFAVVADEVRKLAEKTMNATQEVGNAISGIQQGTAASIRSVESAVQRIDEATSLAGQSGEALVRIVKLVEAASEQVGGIAAASSGQSSASQEIHDAIEQVKEISLATAQGMDEAAQAVDELAGQAEELREVIELMREAAGSNRNRLALA